MLIVWKGASSRIDLSEGAIAGTIVGVGAACSVLAIVFLLPYIYRKLMKDDWELKWWQFIYGPLLLRRPQPPPRPANKPDITDYYAGHLTREELDAQRATAAGRGDPEKDVHVDSSPRSDASSNTVAIQDAPLPRSALATGSHSGIRPCPEGPWYKADVMWWLLVHKVIFRGSEKDVINAQKDKNFLSGNVEDMHARASHYDNKAEYVYSFLQVLTAATASFTHGANDISK